MVLYEIDRLADVEVDTSSLSDIETRRYPTCIEIQSENHSSSESNLKWVVCNLSNSSSPLPDQNNQDETEQNNDSTTTEQSDKYSFQVAQAVKLTLKRLYGPFL